MGRDDTESLRGSQVCSVRAFVWWVGDPGLAFQGGEGGGERTCKSSRLITAKDFK